MAQEAFQGDIAYDWELWIGRDVDDGAGGFTREWTQIKGFEALPFPDQVPEDVDVTHMQSPGRTRETMPGLLPTADWSQEKQSWPASDGDKLLEELANLTAAGQREDVLAEYNINPDGTGSRRTYRSYVNSFNPTGSVGEKAMAALAMKLLDRQPDNPRVIE